MSKQMILREVKGLNEKAGGGRWQFWHGRWYSEHSIASHLHSDQWIKLNVTPLEGPTLYHCSLSVNAWLHSWSQFKIGRLTAQSPMKWLDEWGLYLQFAIETGSWSGLFFYNSQQTLVYITGMICYTAGLNQVVSDGKTFYSRALYIQRDTELSTCALLSS